MIHVGIKSVEVAESQNRVTVEGILDSKVIIKKLKRRGKIAELVHGYRVELNDEDEEKEEEEKEKEKEKDLFNDSFRHKDSSFRHKDSSSFRHKNSSYHHNDSSFRARDKDKGSSHAPEKYDNSESNAFSAKEIPDHICRDKYCTIHKRDNYSVPNMNYGASYPASFRGGLRYNYPPMNSYPPMYGPPPPQYGSQRYGPGMVPPVAGYGGYATQRQRQMPRPDGYPDYFGDKYTNGCNVM